MFVWCHCCDRSFEIAPEAGNMLAGLLVYVDDYSAKVGVAAWLGTRGVHLVRVGSLLRALKLTSLSFRL